MPAIKVRELKRMIEERGLDRVCRHLREAFDERLLKLSDMPTLYEMFGELIDDGYARWASIERTKSGGRTLREATNATDTSAFSNITGQIIYTRMQEEYEAPELIWTHLFTQDSTTFIYGEKIPGVGGLGDLAEKIPEGGDYPLIGPNEDYIETPALEKRGFRVALTRELMIADRTGGRLLSVAGAGSKSLAINCEKRGLDVALGVTNNYKRKGVSTNTYLSSGAYVNVKASTPLYDWTSLQSALLTLMALTDPNTGEPVNPQMAVLIVPPALLGTAARILEATGVEHVDNTVATTTIRTFSTNPLKAMGLQSLTLLSNQYVKTRGGSDTTWWVGNPKKAFRRAYAWDVETVQASSDSEDNFKRDIVMQWKSSLDDSFHTIEPRHMCKVTA